jgi:Holliday junction DNA helicase RuvA
MIGFLSGQPYIDNSKLLIVVNGVGYEVYVGQRVLAQAHHKSDSSISLYIHTHVREDALELFGFEEKADKDLFLLLLSVSGIGPKTALLIADQGALAITDAVQNANVTFFTKLPRVGKKVAQKIIIELKSKLGSLKELKIGGLSEHDQTIVDAVLALGFDEQHVLEVIEKINLTDLTIEAAVKKVLKSL